MMTSHVLKAIIVMLALEWNSAVRILSFSVTV